MTATKAADANYNAATATVNVTVSVANQATLTAVATPSSIVVNATSALSGMGGSGTGAVRFAVTNGGTFCSIVGSTLSGMGVGTCTVTATKAADANYNATTATVNVSIGLANQATLTAIAAPANVAFNATRFVCSAIDVITSRTFPTCAELSPNFDTFSLVFSQIRLR